jgi:hypothetical protein
MSEILVYQGDVKILDSVIQSFDQTYFANNIHFPLPAFRLLFIS